MQTVGTSKDVSLVLRFIDAEGRNNISRFCDECLSRDYRKFDSSEMALMCCDSGGYGNDVSDVFKNYSGFNYRRINACARGNWNYEDHGHVKERERYDEMAFELREAIDNNQRSVGNIMVFRGVPIEYFSEYGVSSVDDLDGLEGGFLLDKGFVSTSLLEESCYYRKPNELGLNYNVKIEYLVPEEFEDGVSIGNVSYSPNQNEYLINVWNMAQVVNVTKDGEDGAIIKAVLIPKKVYDKAYRNTSGNLK